MKVFEDRGKTNIVDINNLVLGWSEGWSNNNGFFVSSTNMMDKVPEMKENFSNGEAFYFQYKFGEDIDLEDYVFNKDYIKVFDAWKECKVNYDYNFGIFKIINTAGVEKYLYVYNFHDGHYGCGFTFTEENGEFKEFTL